MHDTLPPYLERMRKEPRMHRLTCCDVVPRRNRSRVESSDVEARAKVLYNKLPGVLKHPDSVDERWPLKTDCGVRTSLIQSSPVRSVIILIFRPQLILNSCSPRKQACLSDHGYMWPTNQSHSNSASLRRLLSLMLNSKSSKSLLPYCWIQWFDPIHSADQTSGSPRLPGTRRLPPLPSLSGTASNISQVAHLCLSRMPATGRVCSALQNSISSTFCQVINRVDNEPHCLFSCNLKA
jgi:hypothetical protein